MKIELRAPVPQPDIVVIEMSKLEAEGLYRELTNTIKTGYEMSQLIFKLHSLGLKFKG